MRSKFKFFCKSKNRNEKTEQELLKQIDNENDHLISLTDEKIELVSEASFLINDFHLKKLNEIIESFEKNLQSSSFQNMGDKDPKGSDKANSVEDDNISIEGSGKRAKDVSTKVRVATKGQATSSLAGKKRRIF